MTESGRDAVLLDGEWRFIPDPEHLFGPGSLPDGEPIQVPGCWEAQVDRPYRIITAWYRRSFHVPAEWQGDRVLVRFGAVMYRCRAWLNGRLIGEHEGGYTPFDFDTTAATRWGEPNELVVEVANPLNAIAEYPALAVDRVLLAEELVPDLPLSGAPHGKQTWYSSQSGIWQSVRVERAPSTHLTAARIFPDLFGERVVVDWTLATAPVGEGERPEAGGGPAGSGTSGTGTAADSVRHTPDGVRLEVFGPDGAPVATEQVALSPDVRSGSVVLPVPEPKAWDIGRPNLYRLVISLCAHDEVHDTLALRFGMRSISTQDGHVVLNGRPIYLLGALDQDLYPDNDPRPPSRAFLDRQFALAREMGFNMLRCHIKVPDPSYLDAADEAGILLWCELPNWTTFTSGAAGRGRETLRQMVEVMGHHPSIVVWTIINEDWGTNLRYEARDRAWLRETYDWLKALDPTRLVVDNSACETPDTPNFHVRTDLLDFHAYFGAPDNAIRWRNWVADFARRPGWLWSPHGDAFSTGEEPLVLSEFGSWGLPRIDSLLAHYGRQPWWFGTGLSYYRPSGVRRRFRSYGLDRIWRDVDELAEATQWHQFENLQYEVAEIRRHTSVQGYVATEFTDANWEANGFLDIARTPKVYHSRLAAVNAPDVVVTDLIRRDVWSGGTIDTEVTLSSYSEVPEGRGAIEWELELEDGGRVSGEIPVPTWPRYRAAIVGRLRIDVPDVEVTTDAWLRLAARDPSGTIRARDELRLAVLAHLRPSRRGLDVAVHDPGRIWGVADRISDLGHRIVAPDDAGVLVTTEADDAVVRFADRGGRVLVLVRTRDALPEELDLARRVNVHLRRLPHAGWPGQASPWEGDWVTSYSWMLPSAQAGLPRRNPLDFAYGEVLPDHVLLGYDPTKHVDEVTAGMFVGWIHAPAALCWSFAQGNGHMALTTFRVCPSVGPVATVMLQSLLEQATGESRLHDADQHEPVAAGPRERAA